MPALDPSALLPPGLVVDEVEVGPDLISITAHPAQAFGTCPTCGLRSDRVHSLHRRRLLDLPSHGRSVELLVRTCRFRCLAADCPRRTFTQPPLPEMAGGWRRRTIRLDGLVEALGVALGGRPGAALAQRLMLPVGKDTLLRAVRRRWVPGAMAPAVIGIDEWAWRRRQRYGTLICDLERRRVLDLLPDREPTTVRAWLASHPDIAVIARDRAGGFAGAAAAAAPGAIQVADRWHLMENASAALVDAVHLSMRAVRGALGAATINPALLTAAERLQHEGFLRREDTTRQILALKEAGHSIKEIVRRTRHSRKLVRQAVRGTRGDVFRIRQSSLDAYLPVLDAEWASGCRNGAELWRRLRDQGFQGSLRVVSEWTTRRRRADQMQTQGLQKAPSARTLARLMGMGRDHLTKADTMTVAAVEAGVPGLVDARNLVERFQAMIRTKAAAELDGWLEQARASLIAPLARGVSRDVAAIKTAITEPWSNGQTEGQITKLKLVKRQMYGRAKLDLLEARLIGAA
ncbi:MAG TPA: ISL3 family transposase [Roseomonas sp.]|jgi:transposase